LLVLATISDARLAKAQQTQKNAKLTASQRDALQARLKDIKTKARQTQRTNELAATQRDALQAELKDIQAKAQQAQKNSDLAQLQPNTEVGSPGEKSDPTSKMELVAQDDQASDLHPARSIRRSSESKKGRHAVKHRIAGRRENHSLRAIAHWLRRHLLLAVY
jgi:hypothetical protein